MNKEAALKKSLIRLAYANPEFRQDLLPLILDNTTQTREAGKDWSPEAFKRWKEQQHPVSQRFGDPREYLSEDEMREFNRILLEKGVRAAENWAAKRYFKGRSAGISIKWKAPKLLSKVYEIFKRKNPDTEADQKSFLKNITREDAKDLLEGLVRLDPMVDLALELKDKIR